MDLFESLLIESRQSDPWALLLLKDHLEEEGKIMLLEVGKRYLIMTLTHYWTGECVESTPGRTVLKDPAWIPDTGRLSDALATGQLNEVEPLPDGETVVLNTAHIAAALVWGHELPRERR